MKRVRIKKTASKIVSCCGREIVRYAFAAALVFNVAACDTPKPATNWDFGEPSDSEVWYAYLCKRGPQADTCAYKLKACRVLLSQCAKDGILDARGKRAFDEISQRPSVSRYVALIEECVAEESFFDVVGETDAWAEYIEVIKGAYEECAQ